MKLTAKQHLIHSAVCTAVFALIFGLVSACGGGASITTITSPTPPPGTPGSATVARVSTYPAGHSSIYPKGSGAFLAGFFFQSAPAPSQLPESFEGTCDVTGVSPATLAIGFTLLSVANGVQCSGGTGSVVSAVGGLANVGIPVALSGTITVLKVSVITQNNQKLRCLVLNGNAPVNDNDQIQPYYNFNTNTAVLGVGTTTLPVSCQVPVAAGDQAAKVSMVWSKT
jgi:hypothetical protein